MKDVSYFLSKPTLINVASLPKLGTPRSSFEFVVSQINVVVIYVGLSGENS